MTTTPATQPTAADTFNADRESALQLALDITALLESYYEGERIDWGHVGTMAHIKSQLAEAFDTLLGDDEAPEGATECATSAASTSTPTQPRG